MTRAGVGAQQTHKESSGFSGNGMGLRVLVGCASFLRMPFARVSPEKRSPKTRPHHSKSYLRAREIQRVLFGRLVKPDVTDCDFMLLARAWCSLEDCIRNMRMIPRIKGINMSAIALERRLRRWEAKQRALAA
jgi:hypothetical protein